MLDNHLSKKVRLKVVHNLALLSFSHHLDNFDITLISAPFSSRNRWLSALSCSRLWNKKNFIVLSFINTIILIRKLGKLYEIFRDLTHNNNNVSEEKSCLTVNSYFWTKIQFILKCLSFDLRALRITSKQKLCIFEKLLALDFSKLGGTVIKT